MAISSMVNNCRRCSISNCRTIKMVKSNCKITNIQRGPDAVCSVDVSKAGSKSPWAAGAMLMPEFMLRSGVQLGMACG